jgi:hypothetical protein
MSDTDSDIDIDIDDEELIKLQYKQKGIDIKNPKPFYANMHCKPDKNVAKLSTQIQYVDNLSTNMQKALEYYTSDGYNYINEYLRDGVQTFSKKVYPMIQQIDSAFEHVPALTSDITVYRGIRSSFNIRHDFIEKAYTSTTTEILIAIDFNAKRKCCVFKINVPKGKKILPLLTCSENKSETEILLPRNSKFKFTSLFHDAVHNVNLIELQLL